MLKGNAEIGMLVDLAACVVASWVLAACTVSALIIRLSAAVNSILVGWIIWMIPCTTESGKGRTRFLYPVMTIILAVRTSILGFRIGNVPCQPDKTNTLKQGDIRHW